MPKPNVSARGRKSAHANCGSLLEMTSFGTPKLANVRPRPLDITRSGVVDFGNGDPFTVVIN